MRITITPTDQLTTLHGQAVRVWDGTTDTNQSCQLLVAGISLPVDEAGLSGFAREIQEQLPPGRFLPLTLFLSGTCRVSQSTSPTNDKTLDS